MPWFRDRETWAFIGRGYLPWIAGLNLAWETLQIPLYTIWTEASAGAITLAIVHCTVGDALISSVSLVLALILGREGPMKHWHWRRIVGLMLLLGPGYSILSEWLNTTLFRWSYSDLMPTLKLAGIEIGVSPLLQWLTLPPLALYLVRRSSRAITRIQPNSRRPIIHVIIEPMPSTSIMALLNAPTLQAFARTACAFGQWPCGDTVKEPGKAE